MAAFPRRPLHLLLFRLPLPTRTLIARPLTTTPTQSKSITDSAKEAVKTIDRVAGTAALKGIQTGESIAQTAKSTVSGTVARGAEGVRGGDVAGKAKSTAAAAGGEGMKVKNDIKAKADEIEERAREAAREGVHG